MKIKTPTEATQCPALTVTTVTCTASPQTNNSLLGHAMWRCTNTRVCIHCRWESQWVVRYLTRVYVVNFLYYYIWLHNWLTTTSCMHGLLWACDCVHVCHNMWCVHVWLCVGSCWRHDPSSGHAILCVSHSPVHDLSCLVTGPIVVSYRSL